MAVYHDDSDSAIRPYGTRKKWHFGRSRKKSPSRIRNDKVHSKEKDGSDDEGQQRSLFSMIRPYAVDILLVLFLIILTAKIHLDAYDMPFLDSRAESAVEKHYRNSIIEELRSDMRYTPEERVIEAQRRFEQMMSSDQADELREAVAERYKNSYRDENGVNYLYGADPYYYFKQTKDLFEKGIEPDQNLPRVYASWHRFLSFFGSDTLVKNMIYLPMILSLASMIAIYLTGVALQGRAAGFIAGLVLTMTPSFLLNTRIGFIDTNSFNVLLSLMIMFFFILTMRFDKGVAIYGIMLAASITAFSLMWKGFFYLPLLIIAFLAIMIASYYLFIGGHKDSKYLIYTSGITFGIIGLLALFMQTSMYGTLIARLQGSDQFFPSGLLTVAELQGYSFSEIVTISGGLGLMVIVFAGLAFILYDIYRAISSREKMTIRIFFARYSGRVFLAFIFIALFITPFFAKRFTIYMLLPFSILAGYGVSAIIDKISGLLNGNGKTEIREKGKVSYSGLAVQAILVVAFSALILALMNPGLASAKNTMPHMNDAIYNTALEIKYNSSDDAVINMWWDYGYLYSAIADRDVAFDGGSFESSRLHWISLAMLTDDEALSYGILRMLDCGEERTAFNIVNYTQEESISMEILHDIISLEQNEASVYLDSLGISQSLLERTHCTPRESFIVIGSELERKISILNYYAFFDFRRNSDRTAIKGMKKDEAISYFGNKYSVDADEAGVYYGSVVSFEPRNIDGVSFRSEDMMCRRESEMLLCSEGIIVNTTSFDALVNGKVPLELLYFDGVFHEKVFDDASLANTLAVIDIGTNPGPAYAFLINPKFSKSMLARMLYFEGYGLERFEKFHKETVPQKVVSYRVLH